MSLFEEIAFWAEEAARSCLGGWRGCDVFEEEQSEAGWNRIRGEESGRSSVRQVIEQIIGFVDQNKDSGFYSEWDKKPLEEVLSRRVTYTDLYFQRIILVLCWEGSGPGRKQRGQVGNYCTNLARGDNRLSWRTGCGIQEKERYQGWLPGLGLRKKHGGYFLRGGHCFRMEIKSLVLTYQVWDAYYTLISLQSRQLDI